jgi:MerR family transcriptional regulator, thiopeptide resistance regulator
MHGEDGTMAWSIAEVARMARTTSRTLRHYHQIGLLEPAWIGENGYRYYEREQLLRLQQILLLRELDVDLDTIGDILAGQQDPADALRAHQRRIAREQRRLERLQRTLGRTLEHIERGAPMPAEDFFDAFGKKQRQHERELVERLGGDVRPHIEESRRNVAEWSRADFASANDEYREILARLAALKARDLPPGSEEVQAVIADHRAWLTRFWTPDPDAYAGLGEMYTADARFRGQIDAVEPGLAEFLRDAMAVHAEIAMP